MGRGQSSAETGILVRQDSLKYSSRWLNYLNHLSLVYSSIDQDKYPLLTELLKKPVHVKTSG